MKVLIIIWIMVITTGIASASYINQEINKNVQEVKESCDPNIPLLCPHDTFSTKFTKESVRIINKDVKVYEDGSVGF